MGPGNEARCDTLSLVVYCSVHSDTYVLVIVAPTYYCGCLFMLCTHAELFKTLATATAGCVKWTINFVFETHINLIKGQSSELSTVV